MLDSMNKSDQRKAEAAMTGKLDGRLLDFEDRMAAIDQVRAILDHQVATAVIMARYDGLTWDQIGVRLGISRQAAHQRFAHLAD